MDSIYQVYAAFYKDVPSLTKRVDESDRNFDKFIRKSFTNKSMNEIIVDRSELICSLFPKKVIKAKNKLHTIDIYIYR